MANKIVTGDRYMVIDAKLMEIKRQLRQKGGYPFDLDALEPALQRLIEGDLGGSLAAPAAAGGSKTLAEMLAAGRYDWVNPNITQEHLPVDPDRFTTEGCKLFWFGYDMTKAEVEAAIRRDGYESAFLDQLLAYGAAHPEEQREFPIVAFGSSWADPRGGCGIPYLDEGNGERRVSLHWSRPEIQWLAICRFLAFRRS